MFRDWVGGNKNKSKKLDVIGIIKKNKRFIICWREEIRVNIYFKFLIFDNLIGVF